jgi:hypothetical protein
MAEPYAIPNEVQGTLTSDYVHGTDNHLHLAAIGLFASGGGFARVYTTDKAHWALLEYTGVSTNDLTGLTQANLTGLLHTDAAYTFPAGSIVDRVATGEDVSKRIMGPASATDGAPVGFDGTTGNKAKELTAAAMSAFLGTFTTASVTLYVAKTGNDANAGTSGSPKLTITGALAALPITIAHACYVNVMGGTYTEPLTTPLSRFNVLASLTIRAVNTSDVALHFRGTASAGAATTVDVEDAHVTADDQWNGGQIILRGGTGSGQIRDITDSATSNNRITVATWETNPANDSTYILTGMVVIDGDTTSALSTFGCRNVYFEGIRFTVSNSNSYNCVDLNGFSYLTFTDCLFDDIYAFSCGISSSAMIWYCGFRIPANGYGLTCQSGSFVFVTGGVVYGAKSGDYGVYIASGGTVNVASLQVRHCATGVFASGGGWQLGSYITYTDNTTKANPDTPSDTAAIVTDGFSFIQDQA